MAGARDHGIFPVGAALACAERMHVRISHYRQSEGGAPLPESPKGIALKHADAGVVGVRVELVVIEHGRDLALAPAALPEQKDARLVDSVCAAMKFARHVGPKN